MSNDDQEPSEDPTRTSSTGVPAAGAVVRQAEDHTLVIVGATERGLLSRLARGTLHFNVVNEINASVLMAERPTSRSLFRMIFGS